MDSIAITLTTSGRLNLLGAGLQLAPRIPALELVEAFLRSQMAGYPIPVLCDLMGEARWHASIAAPSERKAYALAHYDAMQPSDQDRFLAHVTKKERVAA